MLCREANGYLRFYCNVSVIVAAGAVRRRRRPVDDEQLPSIPCDQPTKQQLFSSGSICDASLWHLRVYVPSST